MEIYQLLNKNKLVNTSYYTNYDHVLIQQAIIGRDKYVIESVQLQTVLNEPSDELACYHQDLNCEVGEFFIQNEDGDQICELTVMVYPIDRIESVESSLISDTEISEDYDVTIGNVYLSQLNLSKELKADISNIIDTWIGNHNNSL